MIIGISFLKRMPVMEKAQKCCSKNLVRNSLGASGKWRQLVWCNREADGYKYHPCGGIWTCKIYTKEGTLPSWETEIFTGFGQRMLCVRREGLSQQWCWGHGYLYLLPKSEWTGNCPVPDPQCLLVVRALLCGYQTAMSCEHLLACQLVCVGTCILLRVSPTKIQLQHKHTHFLLFFFCAELFISLLSPLSHLPPCPHCKWGLDVFAEKFSVLYGGISKGLSCKAQKEGSLLPGFAHFSH